MTPIVQHSNTPLQRFCNFLSWITVNIYTGILRTLDIVNWRRIERLLQHCDCVSLGIFGEIHYKLTAHL